MDEESCLRLAVFVLTPLGLWSLALLANLCDDHRTCGRRVEPMLLAFTSAVVVVIALCFKAGDRLLLRRRNQMAPIDKLLMIGGLFFLLFDVSIVPAMIGHWQQCKAVKPAWIMNIDWLVVGVLLVFSTPMVFVLIATVCEAAEAAQAMNRFTRKTKQIALHLMENVPMDKEFLHRFRDSLDYIGPNLGNPDQPIVELIKLMTAQTMVLTMTAGELQVFTMPDYQASRCSSCGLSLLSGRAIVFTPCCLQPVHQFCFGRLNSCTFCPEGTNRCSFLTALVARLRSGGEPLLTFEELMEQRVNAPNIDL